MIRLGSPAKCLCGAIGVVTAIAGPTVTILAKGNEHHCAVKNARPVTVKEGAK
jgi:hypothetical protein